MSSFTGKKLPDSEFEIEVTVSFEEFEPQVKRAAILISEENEIEGFRKGKAPYDVVKNKFGENPIYERAADLAVRNTYPKILEELNSDSDIFRTQPPIGSPEITVTKLAPGNELQYKVKLALFPEVKLPDWRMIAARIKKDKKTISVSDEEVRESLEWVRESRSSLITVDRPAQKGDAVEIDFEVRQNGVKIESGESRNHPLVIGKGKFLPGFENQLIGMKTGEVKDFSLTVPEDWQEKSMAGKTFDFHTTMKLVQDRKIPELTDEFAKNLGDFSSVQALGESILKGLTQEKQEKENQRIRSLMIEEIAKETLIEVPNVLIQSELEKMIAELQSGIIEMGMKWEDYLLHIKKNAEELKKEWRAQAEKRVCIALCLREIARSEKIESSEEEIKERANQFLARFQSVAEAKKDIDPAELKEYTRGVLRNEKVFELLETI